MVITNVRIKATGASAAEVELILNRAAVAINHKLMLEASTQDELVIERNLAEPADSEYAFDGRTLLHPNVAPNAEQRQCRALVGDSPSVTTG